MTNARVDAGYAHAIDGFWFWEAGLVENARFGASSQPDRYRFHEFFAGLNTSTAGIRVFHASHYDGDKPALYVDAHASLSLAEAWMAQAHLGRLVDTHTAGTDGATRSRNDVALGVSHQVGAATFLLEWQGVLRAHESDNGKAYGNCAYKSDCALRWVASMSYAW